MHQMRCEEARELLFDYADGTLDGTFCESVREHLSHCRECREEYEQILQDREQLEIAYHSVPDGLCDSVMSAIDKYEKEKKRAGRRLMFVRYGSLAASVAVVIMCAFFIMPKMSDINNSGGSAPQSTSASGNFDNRDEAVEDNCEQFDVPSVSDKDGVADKDTEVSDKADTAANDATNGGADGTFDGDTEADISNNISESIVAQSMIEAVYSVDELTKADFDSQGYKGYWYDSQQTNAVFFATDSLREYCSTNATKLDTDSLKTEITAAENYVKLNFLQFTSRSYIIVIFK